MISDLRELLPCPFCGGHARSDDYRNALNNRFVECEPCGACINGKDAYETWNRRALLAASKEQEWIPVSRGLPKKYTSVLLTDGVTTITGFLDGKDNWTRHDAIEARWNPTHWMPLPAAPSAKEGK